MSTADRLNMKDLLDILPIGGFLGVSLTGYIGRVKFAFANVMTSLEMAEKASGLILTWLQIIAAGIAIYLGYRKLKNR